MKTEIGLACSLLLLGLFASCSNPFAPEPAPTPTLQPVVGVDELRFKDPETGRRFHALDRCIKNSVDDSWQTSSYQWVGNFYTSSWCHGSGARDGCQISDSNIDNRDQRVVELYTLSFGQNDADVFGLGFQSLWVPKSTGWGASYVFAENGASVVGEGWGVTFRKYATPTGDPQATISLGATYSYTIPGPNRTAFEYSSDLPIRQDLALYLSVPQAMRDRGLAQNQALAQKVNTAISEHQARTCDPGPYLGKGIAPACAPRPLTPAEEATELVRAKAYFDQQAQLLRSDYLEMYAAWMQAFPLDECWP